MRFLKMLGLVTLTTTVFIACAEARPASADEVCTTTAVSKMCPEGKLITTLELSQFGTGSFETTGGTGLVSCSGGSISGNIVSQGTGTDPVWIPLNSFNFTGCSGTVTTIFTGSLQGYTFGSDGVINGFGAQWTLGILGTTCSYGFAGAGTMGITFNTNLSIKAELVKTAGSFFCPGEIRWTAAFKITNHSTVDWINN